MSLWADYHKERLLRDTIEKEYGFITYAIRDKECFIADIYIKPDLRQIKLASELVDAVFAIAKQKDCEYVTCSVILDTTSPELSAKSALGYGFKFINAHNNIITFKKGL